MTRATLKGAIGLRLPGNADYAWLITVDHTEVAPGRVGTMGPRNAPADLLVKLEDGEGRAFRLYDDDGELYYEGRILTDETPGSESDFQPLDDFGAPDSGCTRIDYQDTDGVWRAL